MPVTHERLSKERLLSVLPAARTPGITSCTLTGETPSITAPWLDADSRDRLAAAAAESETGAILFLRDQDIHLILPPFPVKTARSSDTIDTEPLIEMLERPRIIAAFLLRRGGYTIGLFRGSLLADSKTDRRFVKNRHKKGGQSQRRFDRIREKQMFELFGKACEDLRETLTPYEQEIEHIFVGGDRQALIAFRKQCDYLDRFGARVARRILPVAGDPRKASLDAVPRDAWSSDVWVTTRDSS
jgi:hypothetical protein